MPTTTLTLSANNYASLTHLTNADGMHPLTAYGPDVLAGFNDGGICTFSSLLSNVSAIITAITVSNPVDLTIYDDTTYTMFDISFPGITLPYTTLGATAILPTTVSFLASAKASSCFSGPVSATITLTLSNYALSGDSRIELDEASITQTLQVFALTAVNTAVGTQPCSERMRILYATGLI